MGYKMILLYTLGDEVRGEFVKMVKAHFSTTDLQDQSSIAITADFVKHTIERLRKICQDANIQSTNGHFVKLYCAAPLENIRSGDDRDCIIEHDILGSTQK